jgi:hypothetical protein
MAALTVAAVTVGAELSDFDRSLALAAERPADTPATTAPSPATPPGVPPGAIVPRRVPVVPGDLYTYTGPTPNLTAVGNSLALFNRSLTTVVVAQRGRVITRPVDIIVTYFSPWNVPVEIRQSYVPSTGNRFLHNDALGDGTRRRITMSITLLDIRPTGPPIRDVFYWQVDLDPLYDVSVGPLRFELLKGCDWFGDSEIILSLQRPDRTRATDKFSLGEGDVRNVNAFAWSRTEASASMNLLTPYTTFREEDPSLNLVGVPTFFWPDNLPALIPGETRFVKSVDESDGCTADLSYRESYTPRYYYDLGL